MSGFRDTQYSHLSLVTKHGGELFFHTATQAVLIITDPCIHSADYATYRVLKTSLKAVSVTKTDTTPGDGPGQVVKVRIYQSS
jgi:hypothetical protein